MSKYLSPIIILLIIISGSLLRFYNLGSQPYWMDEGYTINAVLSVIEKGNTILDSGQNYFCPMYCYPTAWIAHLFGPNATAYRLFAVIAGILLIAAIYLIIKKLFTRHVALLASFFVAFSYWQIAWSRQARWYSLLVLLFWLAIYLFYQFLETEDNKKRIAYFLSAVGLSALAVLTHRIAYLLAPIFLILLALKAWKNKTKINTKIIWIASLIIVSITFLLELSLNFGISRSLIAKFGLYYELPYYLSFFLANYWLFIFLALYAYFGAPKEQKLRYQLLILPFVLYLLVFAFFTDIVHYRYLLAPALGLLLLGAIGAIDIFGKLWHKYRVVALIFLVAVIAIFFVSGQGVWRPLPFYTLENDNINTGKTDRPYYGYTPQPNFNGAYAAIAVNLKPYDIVISSHPQFNKIFLHQPGYWLAYNYLGFENRVKIVDETDREYYVGAEVINDLEELKQITSSTHGYIVFDQMSITGRIPTETIDYISKNFQQIYFNEINEYSRIWVYRF